MNKKLKIKNNNCLSPPSEWIKNNLPQCNTNLNLLDLACGNGRHSIYAASIGYKVTSIDKNKNKLSNLKKNKLIFPIQFDIESNNNWPFPKKKFDVVIVTNYLYRPIFNNIINSIKLHGKLLYETFTAENYIFGKPNNKNYLLEPQELLKLARNKNLKIINYEEIIITKPKEKAIQRIFAQIK